VQAVAGNPQQVLVPGQRPAGHGCELEETDSEVARRWAQAGRGRPLAVPALAVAGPAVLHVAVATGLELRHRDGPPAGQLERLLELLGDVALAGGQGEGGDGGEEGCARHGGTISGQAR
jgi:hypothetical protein